MDELIQAKIILHVYRQEVNLSLIICVCHTIVCECVNFSVSLMSSLMEDQDMFKLLNDWCEQSDQSVLTVSVTFLISNMEKEPVQISQPVYKTRRYLLNSIPDIFMRSQGWNNVIKRTYYANRKGV